MSQPSSSLCGALLPLLLVAPLSIIPVSAQSTPYFRINGNAVPLLLPEPGPQYDSLMLEMEGGRFRLSSEGLAAISVPVLVTGGDGAYSLEYDVEGLDVTWLEDDGSGVVTGTFDESFWLRTIAHDGAENSSDPVDVHIEINPEFRIQPPAILSFVAGQPFEAVPIAEGRIGDLVWNVENGGELQLDMASGALAGEAGAPRTIPGIILSARDLYDDVTDTTDAFDIQVLAPALSVSLGSGTARVGTAFSSPVGVSGGYGTISLDAEDVPPGMQLVDGNLSGVPTMAGTWHPEIMASDAYGTLPATVSSTIVVHSALQASINDITAVSGQPFELAPTVQGGVGTVSWELDASSTALPSGVNVDEADGRVHGTILGATTIGGLVLAAHDDADNAVARTAAFSIIVQQDDVPDHFSIPSISEAVPGEMVTSAVITPTGFDGSVTVSATGAQVSVAGGSYAASAEVTSGQSFRLQVTAPAYGETISPSVRVGSGDAVTWSVSSQGELLVTLGNETNVTVSSNRFGSDWSTSRPKRLVVPSGVTIGATSTSSPALTLAAGMSGTLTIQNDGKILGAGATGNGATGGDAVVALSPGVSMVNTGQVAAGGGSGGQGGAGGSGFSVVGQSAYYVTSGNTRYALMIANSSHIWYYYDGNLVGENVYDLPVWYGETSYRFLRGTNFRQVVVQNNITYWFFDLILQQTEPTAPGVGGAGGPGAGYGRATGGSGAPGTPGGAGSGIGGTGGTGGGLGAAGLTGSAGNNGNRYYGGAGLAGGQPGYAVKNVTVSGSGSLLGRQ